ncbi:hypothetical protein BCR33DRAFT_711129 [Rhizoclosmatium globosum]|uniref:Uncharacterized protein n=1 Tax=Rhizoclosmatium globosum TaxID=329046 RepID=A0A1Y2D3A6_9FUNG|nr:hypothetical protein BCR33DRAFT_711129 [Rhizoclosmatium globosum]|eukprot:ORY53769.1 hypothetical protein BCR33DRAFT_711129 [Rhizoclosmatium globosum]
MSQDTGFVSSGQVEPRDTVISTNNISYIGDSIQRQSGSVTAQSNHQGMTTIFPNSHKGGTSVFSNSYVKSVVFRAVLIAGGFILVWTPPTNEPIPEWFCMMGIWNSVVFFVTSYWTEIGLAFTGNPIEVEAMGSNDGFDVQ